MKSKDQILLEKAYQLIKTKSVNEAGSGWSRVEQITDGGAAHGAYVVGDEIDQEDLQHDRSNVSGPVKSSPSKGIPKYTKIATGENYPQIDRYVHMWYTESPVAGGGGGTYAQMDGPIDDFNIKYWLDKDKEARKFFLKNKVAIENVARKMHSMSR